MELTNVIKNFNLQMTWADIAFTDGCSWVSSIGLKFSEEKTPKLKALTKRVESHPKIAEWIKNRPETPM